MTTGDRLLRAFPVLEQAAPQRPAAGPELREQLIRTGAIVPAERAAPRRVELAEGRRVLRLDSVGRAAAERHVREGYDYHPAARDWWADG
jgi:hypothetical protein